VPLTSGPALASPGEHNGRSPEAGCTFLHATFLHATILNARILNATMLMPALEGSASFVTPTTESCESAIRLFHNGGVFLDFVPFHRGHIHDTFVSSWERGGETVRFLHQRMNHHVFRDIPGLMHNILILTDHLEKKVQSQGGMQGFHTLRLVRSAEGGTYLADEHGYSWRTYDYIENTISYDVCKSESQAFEAARVFGRFQTMLIDLDVEKLRVTIPKFFCSEARFRELQDAVQADSACRVAEVSEELRFVEERKELIPVIAELLRSGEIPQRVVHGDTKLNNVLFDRDSGRAAAVVDLDTCMPGYSLYDWGDLVRFTAAMSREDEADSSKIGTDAKLYAALESGYLDQASGFLTDKEIELMPFAARLVTLTIGMRFLADYLRGDSYFKVERERQNLDRARVQFGMVADMERKLG